MRGNLDSFAMVGLEILSNRILGMLSFAREQRLRPRP
jgi:hypothetical protein